MGGSMRSSAIAASASNPAYNAHCGPVTIYGLRLHAEV